MSVPPTEAEFLGNTVDLHAARLQTIARASARREVERRDAAAQQAADLVLAAEATLRRAIYKLERAEPLADILGAAATSVNHLVEALQCEIAAGRLIETRPEGEK